MAIIVRILINAAALWVAARIIDGITLSDEPLTILIVAAIFGVVNALVRPVVKLLTFPITLLTLGLFILVINAAMLQLTDWLSGGLDVRGWRAAILGGLVISVVSWLLSIVLPDDD